MLEKFVFVKHQNNSKTYIFRVPEDLDLLTGDVVVCDTKFGEQPGTCASDSFITQTPDDILRDMGVSRSRLKPVLRVLQYCEPRDEADDTRHAYVCPEMPKEFNVTFDSFINA